jgi:flagellar motility protein MotE (MotC chaperone)
MSMPPSPAAPAPRRLPAIPTPRLLPTTIAALATLLVLKSGLLLVALVEHGHRPETAMVAVANAEEGKPAAAPPHAEPLHAQDNVAKPPPPIAEGPPPVSESEKALLQELRQRRKELDATADAITARESVLTAAEQKITARVTEMQTLQRKLEGLTTAQKQKEDAGWQGIVKMYEAMKPKDAANIFNEMAMPVLVQVMDRMKDSKAAAVMAAMNPDKARDVTSDLAQLRTGQNPMAGEGPKRNTMTN